MATSGIYRVSQKEKSIFWEVIVSDIRIKNVHMYMHPIPKGFRDGDIGLCSGLDLAPNNVLPSRMYIFPKYTFFSNFFNRASFLLMYFFFNKHTIIEAYSTLWNDKTQEFVPDIYRYYDTTLGVV